MRSLAEGGVHQERGTESLAGEPGFSLDSALILSQMMGYTSVLRWTREIGQVAK